MAGFKAAKAVEPLDYDFNPFVEAKGTIPEPSKGDINEFVERVANAARSAGIPVGDDNEGVDEALEKATKEQRAAMNDELVAAVAEVCHGTPSREDIDSLPARHQDLFFEWLLGEFSDPTQSNGATRR